MINYVYQLVSPRVISIKYENIDFNNDVIVKPLYMAICHADQRYYTGNRDKKVLSKKLPIVILIPNVPGKYNNEIYENYGEGAKFLSSGYDGFMREYINTYTNVVEKLFLINLKNLKKDKKLF